MKASNGYRASNRYLKPDVDVVPRVKTDAHTIVLTLATNTRTAFHAEMTAAEAESLVHELMSAIGRI
jgi:hypothetical protein